MNIWTLEQVRRARSLCVTYALPVEPKYQRAVAERMAERLLADIREQVNPDARGPLTERDTRLTEEWSQVSLAAYLTLQWAPSTLEVELHDGPGAGRVLTARPDLGPINVETRTTTQAIWSASSHPPEERTERTTYALAGWNEDTARWVFRPTTTV